MMSFLYFFLMVGRPPSYTRTDTRFAHTTLCRSPEVIRDVDAPWSNSDEHVAFLRRRLAGRFPTGLGYWAIAPREEPAAFLGWVMLCPCTVAGAEVEIGWRLIRAAWGRGYATEAAAPILAQGFAKEIGRAHV